MCSTFVVTNTASARQCVSRYRDIEVFDSHRSPLERCFDGSESFTHFIGLVAMSIFKLYLPAI
jgi:hypothetical protein